MGIILGKSPHPQKAMQHSGTFITIHRAQFAPADGEFTVAAHLRLVDGDMERAVHRLQLVLHLVNCHGRIHVLTVKVEVAAGLPQIPLGYMRCIEQFIVMFVMFILPVILYQLAKQGAFRMPENQSGADLVINGKQPQFLAKLAMVPFLGFFKVSEIFLK